MEFLVKITHSPLGTITTGNPSVTDTFPIINKIYFSKLGEDVEAVYKNKKCTIRKGALYVKPTTRGRKKQEQ